MSERVRICAQSAKELGDSAAANADFLAEIEPVVAWIWPCESSGAFFLPFTWPIAKLLGKFQAVHPAAISHDATDAQPHF
ncbi:MAG: hypothetical protein AAF585_03570 [Verrucomicrobiota bacterium]